MGLTLRDVERRTREFGDPIPFATIAKVEQGRSDPGTKRLHTLLRVYHLSRQSVDELLELESMAGRAPRGRDIRSLRASAIQAWQAGDVRESLACYLAIRTAPAEGADAVKLRQEAMLAFAVVVGNLGKYHLCRQILDSLLLEKPDAKLRVGIYLQQASTWRALGNPDVAMAFLNQAQVHIGSRDTRYRGWVLHQRASIEIDQREFEPAKENLKKARAAYRAAGRPFEEALSLCAMARLEVERQDASQAIRWAQAANELAGARGFDRVRIIAGVQLARAQLLSKRAEDAVQTLRQVLAGSIAVSDDSSRFYAHYYLWKARLALRDTVSATMELREAGHYLRHVDDESREAIEVRELLGSGGTDSYSK